MKFKRTPKFDYLVCVKNQYQKHLIDMLNEPFYNKFKEIADISKKNNKNKKQILKNFQEELKNINQWDYETLKKHSKFIVYKTNTKYIPKLIKSTIISSTKLLIETSSRKKTKIEYDIPDTINFLKKCFNIISRNFYLEPTLLIDIEQNPSNRLKNLNNSLKMIKDSIEKTINSFLPYDDILEIYLNNIDDDSSEDESSDDKSDNESDNESYVSDGETDNEEDEENDAEEEEEREEKIEEILDEDMLTTEEKTNELVEEMKNTLPMEDAELSDTEPMQSMQQGGMQQPIQQQMQQPIQQGGMQQPMQQSGMQQQQGGIVPQQPKMEVISDNDDIPDEFNFIPMKTQPITKPNAPVAQEVKQINLPKENNSINFLRNVQ